MCLQEEGTTTWGAPQELHALGYCEGHEGEQSIRVKFFLTDESQLGNPQQINRQVSCAVMMQV
jgi:hypothetical protein